MMKVTLKELKKASKNLDRDQFASSGYFEKLRLLETQDPESKKILLDLFHYLMSSKESNKTAIIFMLSYLERFTGYEDKNLLPTLYDLVSWIGIQFRQSVKKCIMKIENSLPAGADYVDPFKEFTVNIVDEETRIMSRVNDHLRKHREKWKIVSGSYLSKADERTIDDIKRRWNLPKRYLDFLINYSPYDMTLENDRNGMGYRIFGAEELLGEQEGLSYNGGVPEPTWDKKYLIVGDRECDPIAIILTDKEVDTVPLFVAEHGHSEMNFKFMAKDIYAFLERLTK